MTSVNLKLLFGDRVNCHNCKGLTSSEHMVTYGYTDAAGDKSVIAFCADPCLFDYLDGV